jgi:hypothetical protein
MVADVSERRGASIVIVEQSKTNLHQHHCQNLKSRDRRFINAFTRASQRAMANSSVEEEEPISNHFVIYF